MQLSLYTNPTIDPSDSPCIPLTHPFFSSHSLLSGDAIDVALEVKRKVKEAQWMSILLGGVEGGLTELQGGAFTYEDVDHRNLRVQAKSLPVLYVNKHSADYARHVVCDATKNKEKALRRVLARLRQIPIEGKYPLGDHRHDVFSTQEVKDYLVTFEELAEVLEWVWTIYAPGGLQLSKEEQNEACEAFEKWRTTGMYWDPDRAKQQQQSSEQLPSQPRFVPFLEFCSWFSHLTIHIEKLRGAVVYSDNALFAVSKAVCRLSLHMLYYDALLFRYLLLISDKHTIQPL